MRFVARRAACGRCSPLLARRLRRARGRSGQRAHRRLGDRSHRRHRTPANRRRSHPGFDRARRRRHHPPHRGARARGRRQLGGLRARQQRRRADRPPDRRAALSHGRLRPVLARPRPLAHRQHHAELRRPPGAAGHATADIFRITLDPGTVITFVPSCAPTNCRSSICGSPTPTRTRSTRSPSTMASSSASPACSRCSSPSCSW